MVGEAADAFFAAASLPSFAYGWSIEGEIPRARGLGSSVALRLGLLHGLNELAGRPLEARQVYLLCAKLEGHPDNAAPAAFGGFAAARPDGAYFRCDISPDLHFVFLVPVDEIETDASRLQLPDQVTHRDAVFNIAQASMITAAFASQRYELLRGSMSDRLHQPYREPAVPHLRPAIRAALKAGSLGGYLSGSGSAVACLTLHDPAAVAAAMQSVLPGARLHILSADNHGVAVES
jgi:homoserine kinase